MLLAACPGPAPVPPECGVFAGDPSAPLQIEPVGLVPGGQYAPLDDGATLQLTQPAQGGFVLYVGARARNLDPCGVTLSAQLLDPGSGPPLTNLDRRRADLLARTADGWFLPGAAHLTSEFPNVPACPDALGRGIDGRDAVLEIVLTDARGRTARATRKVVPRCTAVSAIGCSCVCGPDYRPGGC